MVSLKGEKFKRSYLLSLWIYIGSKRYDLSNLTSHDYPHNFSINFVAYGYYAGNISFLGQVFQAQVYDGINPKGMLKEEGICIDFNRNDRCNSDFEKRRTARSVGLRTETELSSNHFTVEGRQLDVQFRKNAMAC